MHRRDHHRRSIRNPGFDYRNNATYFVTICTHQREHLFGDIRHGIMGLSDMGCVVVDELLKTTIIRPYVHVDTWIVMPNHIHGLIHIDSMDPSHNDGRGMARHAPTTIAIDGSIRSFGKPQSRSLSSVVGSFKSAVTKRINEIRGSTDPVWQRNFHEHIVRSQDELDRIRAYIRNNPTNWPSDEFRS